MSMRDEDFGAALTAVEAEDGLWSPPMAAPARAEELRRAGMDARSRAGSLKSQLDKNRNKLKAAVEETKEVRRAAKNALFYQAEVARLEKLLSQAGVESSKRSTIMDRVPRSGVRALRSTRLPAGRAGTFRLPRWAA